MMDVFPAPKNPVNTVIGIGDTEVDAIVAGSCSDVDTDVFFISGPD